MAMFTDCKHLTSTSFDALRLTDCVILPSFGTSYQRPAVEKSFMVFRCVKCVLSFHNGRQSLDMLFTFNYFQGVGALSAYYFSNIN